MYFIRTFESAMTFLLNMWKSAEASFTSLPFKYPFQNTANIDFKTWTVSYWHFHPRCVNLQSSGNHFNISIVTEFPNVYVLLFVVFNGIRGSVTPIHDCRCFANIFRRDHDECPTKMDWTCPVHVDVEAFNDVWLSFTCQGPNTSPPKLNCTGTWDPAWTCSSTSTRTLDKCVFKTTRTTTKTSEIQILWRSNDVHFRYRSQHWTGHT